LHADHVTTWALIEVSMTLVDRQNTGYVTGCLYCDLS